MSPTVRLVVSIAPLACAIASVRLPLVPLAVVVAFGAAVQLRRMWRAAIPVVVFAATVALLQWFHGAVDWLLPLRTVAVFLLSTLAMRTAPWRSMAACLSPRSKFYSAGLFLLFVRHFTEILIAETQRTLRARAMCAPSLLRAGGFASLANAVAAVFRRSLVRAEHFYAAQLLNGIVQ